MTTMRILILLLSLQAGFAQQCKLPATVPSTRATRVDYKNKNITTDYYGLSLSWSPQFCNSGAGQSPNNRWQCVDNQFGFVVHGLWPQSAKATRNDEHPRFCKAPELLSANTIQTHLCTMPGAQLVQDQWNKHGSCAWPNAKAYLDQVETLYKSLVLPELKAGRSTSGAIRKAIVAANKSKGLKPEHTEVRVRSGNRFSEFMICYDKQFRFTACQDAGAPDPVEVRVAPKR